VLLLLLIMLTMVLHTLVLLLFVAASSVFPWIQTNCLLLLLPLLRNLLDGAVQRRLLAQQGAATIMS
jgi:hypothetical protein